MSIKVNLLPEARIAKLRNRSRKTRYIAAAGLVGTSVLAAIVVLIMLQVFLVSTFAQGDFNIGKLNTDIDKYKNTEQVSATLQANLASFYTLNNSRTYASRIFSNLFKAVPDNITISSVAIDNKGIVTISGTTDSYISVSKFASTLQLYNVDYLPQPDLERKPIFIDPSITSVSKAQEGKVSFSIGFKVDQSLLKQQRSQ